ncbi:MAG: hypothetical protein AAGG56_06050 [Pseudomonadota bacterium]
MKKFVPVAIAAALLAAPIATPAAASVNDSLQNSVATQLERIGFDNVDVSARSLNDVSAIKFVLSSSGYSQSEKQRRVSAILDRG